MRRWHLALIPAGVAGLALLALLPLGAEAQRSAGTCTGLPSNMVCVPAGSFSMGDRVGESDELPVHRVRLSQFAIDRYEVSFAEYMQCVSAQRCREPRYNPPRRVRRVKRSRTELIKNLPGKGKRSAEPAPQVITPKEFLLKVNQVHVDPQWPVAGITWQDASNYCLWKNKVLPTEAQWEYAARGPRGNYFPWGNGSRTCERANTHHCGGQPMTTKSLPKGKSPFGAHHMTGNVWEWVRDWYDRKYYASTNKATDPTGPTNVQDLTTRLWKYRHRVLRGGSFSGIPADIRPTYRFRLLPSMYANDIGFRCARGAAAGAPGARRGLPARLGLARRPTLRIGQ